MLEIHGVVGGVSMKGLIEIKKFLNLMNIRLIRDNLTIK
jgi:hypothetical protein